jgi:LPS-assembly protein
VVDPGAAGGADVRGWRGNLRPSLAFDLTRPGFYFRPGAALDLTTYRLQDTGLDPNGRAKPANPTRTLPVLTIDSGVQLERSDARRLVTLEPRLYYVYIPYRDQSMLPAFDSGLPDPNFVSLFRANRYTGLDRIGEANNLTLGLTSRLLHPGSGQRLVSATIGETLHFDSACTSPATVNGQAAQPRCVLLPGEAPDTRRRSDLILNVDVTALKNWNLHYELAWNPGSSQTEKAVLALQYRPSGDRVVNVGYRFARPTTLTDLVVPGGATQPISNGVDQAEFSVAWPVSRHWDLYARSAYALGDSARYLLSSTDANNVTTTRLVTVHSLENFAGFQYRGNCWGLRLVARDAVSRTAGSRDRGWYLQLELNGLSSVGSGAEAFLRGAIRGYSPAPPGH